MPFTHVLALGISCMIVLVVASKSLTRRSVYPLPPGPRPLPILGNVLQINTKQPWLTYTAWGKKYGKIVHASILGTDLIIINCETTARELMGKRSANYSSRPVQVIRTMKLANLCFLTGTLPYGETLRKHRKIFHEILRAEVLVSYHEMSSRHANSLVLNLLDLTSDLKQRIEIYAASLIVAVTYGHLADEHEGPFLTHASELAHIAGNVVSPEWSAILTACPFLKKLPSWCSGGACALIERGRELSQRLLNEPFNEVKEQMANGTASHSLITNFLSRAHDDADEAIMKDIALTGYMAGMDTTAATLHTFILAMVLYPDVQTKARADINQAVGHDKMPCLDDRASLPYIDAILLEVLRWHVLLPLGVPHATSNDDVYNGYFIPKGTIIIANQWALSRNEDVFPDASRFDPSRHLTVDGKLKDFNPIVNYNVFGYGRRICPGRWFAENSLWTAAAAMLAVLHIDHAKDSNGQRIEVKPEFDTAPVVHAKPFHCSFKSVSIAREEHLRAMVNSK